MPRRNATGDAGIATITAAATDQAPQAPARGARRGSAARRGRARARRAGPGQISKIESLIEKKRDEIKTLKMLLRLSRKIDGLS